jgi:hypothetical protein
VNPEKLKSILFRVLETLEQDVPEPEKETK